MTREEAIARIENHKMLHKMNESRAIYISEALDMAIKALEQESKTGHWISHREHCEMNNLRPSGLGSYFWCSECDCGVDSKVFSRINYNYCPKCGADMKGAK